ncbi:TlpA family protein disulfide reductase [Flavobacteriaceae bacterium]|nr:TlpA family protein disulfide reductase [Flavobacteriaceae bacterium]
MKKIFLCSSCLVLFFGCNREIPKNKNISDLEYMERKTTFVDLNDNKVNLRSYKGKKIVINYWATWCGPCIKEMPGLKRAEEILKNHNYTFLLVSDETISKISTFKNIKKFDFNFLKSVESNEMLGIYSLPTSHIFDENGKKIETIVGTITWDSKQIINKLKIL